MIKWMAFIAFLWFFGMILGSSYEGTSLETYHASVKSGTENMTAETTLEYLLDFSGSESQTDVGTVFFKLSDFEYYKTWMGMFLFDFSFLKDYDSGTGEFNETIASYAFKLLGAIGLLCFVMTFITVIQGFIPGT